MKAKPLSDHDTRLTRRTVTGTLAALSIPTDSFLSAATGGDGPIILEAAEARLHLARSGPETTVWAYNGRVPGPLIRIKKGQELQVRLVNRLAQPTTLCWHGVRGSNAMDGVAGLTQAPVAPGASFDYHFTPPDAGLFWYHPHAWPHTAEQVARGLFGLLIVDEPDPPPVDQDTAIVIANWRLDGKGQIGGPFDRPSNDSTGDFGGLVTVNGAAAPAPPTEVRPGARVRLRLLNASAAQVALVMLQGAAPTIVAIDGQPSELFPPAGGTMPIGPGARFEIIADMPAEAGKTVTLALASAVSGKGFAPGAQLASFVTKGAAFPRRPPVSRLPENTQLPSRIPLERAIKPVLTIAEASAKPGAKSPGAQKPGVRSEVQSSAGWTIDGIRFEGFSGKPLFRVKRGGAVSLSLVNKTAATQQMHLHGHVFRVLHDLDDGWDPYWRDSILIGPGKTKHIAFIADNRGKWVIESLILDRQVNGLAGWFQVD